MKLKMMISYFIVYVIVEVNMKILDITAYYMLPEFEGRGFYMPKGYKNVRENVIAEWYNGKTPEVEYSVVCEIAIFLYYENVDEIVKKFDSVIIFQSLLIISSIFGFPIEITTFDTTKKLNVVVIKNGIVSSNKDYKIVDLLRGKHGNISIWI